MELLILEPGVATDDGVNFESNREVGPMLYIRISSPTSYEIDQIRRGKARFALVQKNGVIFLLAKFGELSWYDAPYHVSLYPLELWGVVDEYRDGQRLNLMIELADSNTGRQCAARQLTWSPSFSEFFVKLVSNQMINPVSREEYESAVQRAYAQYPGSKAMLPIAFAQCKGGD